MCPGPVECGGVGEIHHWSCYMRHDLIDMLKCDGIVLLPDWFYSTGARIELKLADDLGMPSWAINNKYTEIYPWRNHG